MKEIVVTGPSTKDILTVFVNSLSAPSKLPSITLKGYNKKSETTFDVVITAIDAAVWQYPQSHFDNEPGEKRILIFDGWISSEKSAKRTSTIVIKCRIKIIAGGEMVLIKKRKR